MKDYLKALQGKKTYLAAACVAAAAFARAAGWLPTEAFEPLVALAGALGLYGLRDALRRYYDMTIG